MGLTGCGKFGKAFLILINIIFFLLGLGLFILGILMKVNVSAISDEVKPALNAVTVTSFKLGDLVDNLSILFIAIGIFVLIVAGLGLFGACCEVKCMLVTYAILVILLFIMKVTAVALWFTMKGELDDAVQTGMLKSLKASYKDDTINSPSDVSNAWNYMFMSLDCCAVSNSPTDFDNTPWDKGSRSGAKIPRTCCKGVDSSDYSTVSSTSQCVKGISRFNAKGCYEALQDQISTYGNVFIGVGITILLIELLAVVFACMICYQTGKDEIV
ncbi:tetraspanin-18B-like isoform X1 [Saccostrea cucullata]|uniref:tetraspanin-18B-like isoform X1 n=1 Tax=Saccostrea cuccullata TaxID=36930 RepID=UPI002ED00124